MVPICSLVYGSTANDGLVLDKYFFAATTDGDVNATTTSIF